MKHSETYLKITIALLALAVLSYVGVFLHDRGSSGVRTAELSWDMYEDVLQLRGVLVREETTVKSGTSYFNVTAAHGRRVASGETLGMAYGSEETLLRVARLRSLNHAIAVAEEVLSGVSQQNDAAERAESARSAVLALSADIAGHDLAELSGDVLRVRSLIFADGEELTRQELEQMRQELVTLREQVVESGGAEPLTAPASGMFTPTTDGYEWLQPAALTNLSASALETLLSAGGSRDARIYGKLVSGFEWYLAAMVDEADAARLRVGDTVMLDLTAYRAGRPQIEVLSVSAPEEGRCAVVFSCATSLTETLELRMVNCGLICSITSGFRVPAEAVYRDEAGQTYIYLQEGPVARRTDVEVLRELEGDVLCQGEGLQEGRTLLMGRKLYDGKGL